MTTNIPDSDIPQSERFQGIPPSIPEGDEPSPPPVTKEGVNPESVKKGAETAIPAPRPMPIDSDLDADIAARAKIYEDFRKKSKESASADALIAVQRQGKAAGAKRWRAEEIIGEVTKTEPKSLFELRLQHIEAVVESLKKFATRDLGGSDRIKFYNALMKICESLEKDGIPTRVIVDEVLSLRIETLKNNVSEPLFHNFVNLEDELYQLGQFLPRAELTKLRKEIDNLRKSASGELDKEVSSEEPESPPCGVLSEEEVVKSENKEDQEELSRRAKELQKEFDQQRLRRPLNLETIKEAGGFAEKQVRAEKEKTAKATDSISKFVQEREKKKKASVKKASADELRIGDPFIGPSEEGTSAKEGKINRLRIDKVIVELRKTVAKELLTKEDQNNVLQALDFIEEKLHFLKADEEADKIRDEIEDILVKRHGAEFVYRTDDKPSPSSSSSSSSSSPNAPSEVSKKSDDHPRSPPSSPGLKGSGIGGAG